MSKIERKLMAHYMDAAEPSATSVSYLRLGKDLEEYKVEMSANVETKRNILGETSTVIDGYEKSAGVEPYYADSSDPLYTRLQKIVDEERTLDDLKTTVVDVHLWEESETTAGSYVAYRENAIIEVVSYGGDTKLGIPFNLHFTGNRVKGLFNLSTKTFTADSASSD